MKKKLLIAVPILAIISIMLYFFIMSTYKSCENCENNLETVIPKHLAEQPKPDFTSFKDTKAKKKAFFEYFYPLFVNKNIDIISLRNEISSTRTESETLGALCKKHKIECKNNDYTGLLDYINIIPPSLSMAQAANESAWGTSRFTRLGNNYFGIWCFSKGCGIVPSGRSPDLVHEVRKFKDAKEAVSFYVDNLNRNHHYATLREVRKTSMDSTKLATGLLSYSEKGQVYVDEIIQMIKYNKLNKYDEKMFIYLKDNS